MSDSVTSNPVSGTRPFFSCCTPSEQKRSATCEGVILAAKVAVAALASGLTAAAIAFAAGAPLPFIMVAAGGTAAVVTLIALAAIWLCARRRAQSQEIQLTDARFGENFLQTFDNATEKADSKTEAELQKAKTKYKKRLDAGQSVAATPGSPNMNKPPLFEDGY